MCPCLTFDFILYIVNQNKTKKKTHFEITELILYMIQASLIVTVQVQQDVVRTKPVDA